MLHVEMGGENIMTSRFAVVVGMGLICVSINPANAADLGGGCCADLEERVAELEATTARKGNRVVSLQVYGQVNKGLLIWDDGVDSDTYVVNNSVENTNIGFTGTAKIAPGLTAGYTMEFDIENAQSDAVTQSDDDAGSDGLVLSKNHFFIESETLGKLTVGEGDPAADGATEVVVAESLRHSDPNFGAGLELRYAAVPLGTHGTTLGDVAGNLGPDGGDYLRYDSPSILGFVLSASWGENDYADAALNFEKEFETVKIAAAVAYIWNNDAGSDTYEQVGGSISLMHIPTGLYAAFQAGSRDHEAAGMADPSFWYVQAGIEKKWLPYGVTTLYGEYGDYDDFAVQGAETTRWGFGLNQKIDSAAMDVYAHATFWSFDGLEENNVAPEDITTVLIGSRIQF
jgi:hypothetical protein